MFKPPYFLWYDIRLSSKSSVMVRARSSASVRLSSFAWLSLKPSSSSTVSAIER